MQGFRKINFLSIKLQLFEISYFILQIMNINQMQNNGSQVVEFQKIQLNKRVQLQFIEHSNRRKMKSYSMCRNNSISAIDFIWLYFEAISIFVVWLSLRSLHQVAILRHGHMARCSSSLVRLGH